MKADPAEVNALQASLGINEVLCQILVQRGIKTFEDARGFFRPSLSALHNPFLMKDMDKAVDRIMRARGREKILVFGD